MRIRFNGELTETDTQCLAEFLSIVVDSRQAFAVSVNGDFVPKQAYQHTSLKEGDQLDVLSPMQGG